MSEQRILTIKGKTNKSYRPDQIQVTFNPEGRNKSLSKSLELLEKKLEKLKKDFEQIGLPENSVYMKEISISEGNDRKGRTVLYSVTQELIIKMDLNYDLLNQILRVISEVDNNSSVSISYTLKNQEQIELELLADMTRDAYEKAKVVCANSDSKLGKLQKYSFDRDSINKYFPEREKRLCSTGSFEKRLPFLECDDIYFETAGYFVWELID